MIEFHYELDFQLSNEAKHVDWIKRIALTEMSKVSKLDFIFCTDEYLLIKNQQFLNHDSYTDIITFDYSEGNRISGDIFISIDRLKENSDKYNVRFEDELLRVMAHGTLHLLGYKDKTEVDSVTMRQKENEKMQLFHVEQ